MQNLKNSIQTLQEEKLQKLDHNIRNLRIADLEIFISAAHMKNLGKAAKVHHLSQSATSSAVQRVETAFGVYLCTHERRQFRLTHEGQVLLPKIEALVTEMRNLISPNQDPPIRLVTTHAIAQISVPALMAIPNLQFKHMRPDEAYAAILNHEADMALVLNNFPWTGVITSEIGKGGFGLYARNKTTPLQPILLPEDQMEVLSLKENWRQVHGYSLPVKSKIPSWSIIGQVCANSDEVGFLPDFLAKEFGLKPVLWQPAPYPYRILAIYKKATPLLEKKFSTILELLCQAFS